MAEDLGIPAGLSREETYRELFPRLKALVEGEEDLIANMANFAAALKECFGFLWIGFYRLEGSELILGPFQGPLACTRIAVGRGVCGTAVRDARTVIVPDVEKFPGHIACSSRSRSEIVVPLFANGHIHGVLDLDSENPGEFSELDAEHLEGMVSLLARHF